MMFVNEENIIIKKVDHVPILFKNNLATVDYELVMDPHDNLKLCKNLILYCIDTYDNFRIIKFYVVSKFYEINYFDFCFEPLDKLLYKDISKIYEEMADSQLSTKSSVKPFERLGCSYAYYLVTIVFSDNNKFNFLRISWCFEHKSTLFFDLK
jgi:hypothetical protein